MLQKNGKNGIKEEAVSYKKKCSKIWFESLKYVYGQ